MNNRDYHRDDLPIVDTEEYLCMIDETLLKSIPNKVVYTMVGLAGEAGEVANIAKKCMREDFTEADLQTEGHPQRVKLLGEMGDVFYYLYALCDQLGLYPEEVMGANAAKIRSRQARGTIRGDGDDR